MSRDWTFYLEDIVESSTRVLDYTIPDIARSANALLKKVKSKNP